MDVEQAYQEAGELLKCRPEARARCLDRVAEKIVQLSAERDALAEQVAKLENARKATGDNRVGLIQAGQQGE